MSGIKKEAIKRSTELLDELLDAEKLEHCNECGICTSVCPIVKVIPDSYNPRILLQDIFHNVNKTMKDYKPWLCAWCNRCIDQCPQKLDLPQIFFVTRNLAAEHGYLPKFKEALKIIGTEIPFAGICGLVCFEKVNEQSSFKLFHTFIIQELEKKMKQVKPIPSKYTEKIAIIGSGPAGMTAAYDLVKMGYPVTVFESQPQPGGMFRGGIPEYRLPRDVVNTEIDYIKKIGVKINTSTALGKDVTLDELRSDYSAIFIAVGAQRSLTLNIEGEWLKGVFHAIDLLKKMNTGKKVNLGKRIAIIGGGNVAIDAARTLIRLKPDAVTLLYRRSRKEMPANPWEVQQAEKEGIKFHFLVAPKKIVGDYTGLKAVECIRMKLGEPDEEGRKRPIPIEGSEFLMELDTLILAIGEFPDLFFLPDGIDITSRNTLRVNQITLETSSEGIFAGGDVVSGPATVIEAIVAGKKVASSIDNYLTSKRSLNNQ
jgi:NADH-quinone oxidoreductase subunit F